MALVKTVDFIKVEVRGEDKTIGIVLDTVVREDGVVLGRTRWRGSYEPHMDISNAHEEVKKAAAAHWSEEFIEEYKNKTIVRPDGTIDYIFKPKGD